MSKNYILDRTLGFLPLNTSWVPSVRFLLRRNRFFHLKSTFLHKPHILEVGPGGGTILAELSLQGHMCTYIEQSIDAQELMIKHFSFLPAAPSHYDNEKHGLADALVALDVLEHIEDDEKAIRYWASMVKPEGFLCLSVPCHQRKWSRGDEWAGHYRRYEKAQLINLLNRTGLTIEHMECYGFPLANITEFVGRFYYRTQGSNLTKQEASSRSGVSRNMYSRLSPFMRSFLFKTIIQLFYFLQGCFKNFDIGSGYIVIVTKSKK